MSNRIRSMPVSSAAEQLLEKERLATATALGQSGTTFSTSSRQYEVGADDIVHASSLSSSRKRQRSANDEEDDSSLSSTSSFSSSSSSASSSSSSSSSKSKKKKKKKPSKKDSKVKGKKKKKGSKKKKKKKKDKKKGSKKKSKLGAAKKWGEHGVIYSDSIIDKQREFRAWGIDLKNVDPTSLPKNEMLEWFKSYCEDYNTCTMPSDKYYNLEAWELKGRAKEQRKQDKIRARNSELGLVDLRADEDHLKNQAIEARDAQKAQELAFEKYQKMESMAAREREVMLSALAGAIKRS